MERLKCGSYMWGASDAAVCRKALDWIKERTIIYIVHSTIFNENWTEKNS